VDVSGRFPSCSDFGGPLTSDSCRPDYHQPSRGVGDIARNPTGLKRFAAYASASWISLLGIIIAMMSFEPSLQK
jgi:hypothetical protein